MKSLIKIFIVIFFMLMSSPVIAGQHDYIGISRQETTVIVNEDITGHVSGSLLLIERSINQYLFFGAGHGNASVKYSNEYGVFLYGDIISNQIMIGGETKIQENLMGGATFSRIDSTVTVYNNSFVDRVYSSGMVANAYLVIPVDIVRISGQINKGFSGDYSNEDPQFGFSVRVSPNDDYFVQYAYIGNRQSDSYSLTFGFFF